MSPIIRLLIICPLVFLGGFVDAIAGGGGLITLPAYLLAGIPVHSAIATNKVSSAMGTGLTTYRFWKQGYIQPKLSLLCAAFALMGSVSGANLAMLVDDRIFKIILLVVLPLTAVYVFRAKGAVSADSIGQPLTGWRLASVCGVIALVLGVYDGFYGPGTGTFLLLFLTGLAHMGLNDAAGTTKVINLTTGLAALVTYLFKGQVLLTTGLIAGVFGIAGNWLGARCFTRKGAKAVKPVIAVVLSVFFIKIIYELIGGS